MKILIIAEKPSVAKILSKSLQTSPKNMGGYYEDDNYVISNCFGHLFQTLMPNEMDEKYNKWDLDTLPFNFHELKIKVPNDNGVKSQVKILKKLMTRSDISEIVSATDADREGELIFREVLKYVTPKGKKLTRLWLLSLASKDVVLEQFANRLPLEKYDSLYLASLLRQKTDYDIGLNSTMAISSKLKRTLTIGRVQTPTLKIICDLEEKIKNFVEEKTYTLNAIGKNDEFNYYKENFKYYKDLNEVKSLQEKIGIGKYKVIKVTEKTAKERPPKLFNLADLQIYLNKKYGYGAEEVLNLCQELYEKYGLITYPRTEENRISPETALKTKSILKMLPHKYNKQIEYINSNDLSIRKDVIASKDIGSHEALTPTEKKLTVTLSDKLLNTYMTICDYFVLNFYDDAKFSEKEVVIEKNNETFKTKTRNLIEPGYYLGNTEEKDSNNSKVLDYKENEYIDILSLEIVEGKTTPPVRLTEGTLIKTMTNPLKYLEDESKENRNILKETGGLGTPATRGAIIENLKKREFIKVEKGKIFATEKGMSFIKIVPKTTKNIEMTCNMELMLKEIEKEPKLKEKYESEVSKNVRNIIEEIKKGDIKMEDTKQNKNVLCKCPQCDGDIIENPKGYYCSNYKEGCKVSIFKGQLARLGKKELSKTIVKELLTTNKTSKKIKLHNPKSGKDFEAYLVYEFKKDEKYPNSISFSFEQF